MALGAVQLLHAPRKEEIEMCNKHTVSAWSLAVYLILSTLTIDLRKVCPIGHDREPFTHLLRMLAPGPEVNKWARGNRVTSRLNASDHADMSSLAIWQWKTWPPNGIVKQHPVVKDVLLNQAADRDNSGFITYWAYTGSVLNPVEHC